MSKSLHNALVCCLLCSSQWQTATDIDSFSGDKYSCPQCPDILYIVQGIAGECFWLIKHFPKSGLRVWWSSMCGCVLEKAKSLTSLWYPRDSKDLDFVLPFDIDETRLKILMVFQ